ncbi:MAG TPA: ABC transporter ATP-binding protein [Gaiellaceae bacterium]|nr:ABC transporter ATP-binding protein [Gaiellaceae bacterium]
MTVTDLTRPPLYELRGATKTYGQGAAEVKALRDLSLTIESGEFVAVVGPSGSGKTTLLQLLGALDRPSSGQVLFEGRDLATLKDPELTALRMATIGFVFQQFNLIPTVSAAVNIELALVPRHLSADQRRERVDELLGAVGLANRREHLPRALSGGEQQRVAIARALANEPRVLLADEPTGNLDATTGEEIVGLLSSLCDERGQTVVLITHNREISAVAHRTIRLHDGALVPSEAQAVGS